jgi:hypothetical protein
MDYMLLMGHFSDLLDTFDYLIVHQNFVSLRDEQTYYLMLVLGGYLRYYIQILEYQKMVQHDVVE